MLVFDDDPAVAQVIALMASRLGFDSVVETKAEGFFSRLALHEPDFILLDLMMPTMDGIEVMRRLAGYACKSAIIITSGVEGRVLDAARRIALGHGLNLAGIISKPLRSAALHTLLQAQAPLVKTAHQFPVASALSISVGDIKTALVEGKFIADFQPKVDCVTGELRGFEALARWHLASGESIGPDVFIPIVEGAGLIGTLTDQIMNAGLSMLAHYFPRASIGLSVNVSSFGIVDSDFADRAASMCAMYEIETDRVTFEFTESGVVSDSAFELDVFTRIRMKGFHLSIDDFGTGYSSMKRLMELPFSEVKIDRSFVASLTTSIEAWSAVRSIASLAQDLKLIVVAEGVEDEPTRKRLAEVGCDQVQGYLTGRPMSLASLKDWIERDRQRQFSPAELPKRNRWGSALARGRLRAPRPVWPGDY